MANQAELTAVLPDFHFRPENIYFLKTLAVVFAEIQNVSLTLIPYSKSQNVSFVDLMMVDFNLYANSGENPYILTSIVPYYSMSLAIPAIKKINKEHYFSRPFRPLVWYMFSIFPVYFAIMSTIAIRNSNIFDNFFNSFRIFITGHLTAKIYGPSNRFLNFMFILYTMAFFIVYTTYLGSFLIKPLDKSVFHFVCSKSRIKLLGQDIRKDHLSFIIKPSDEYLELLYNLNLDYGYCVTSVFWSNIVVFQNYMKTVFRLVSPWKFKYGHYLRMNKNSKHLEKFNDFLLQAYSSGLIKRWGENYNIISYIKKIKKYFIEEEQTFNFQSLSPFFKFLIYCLGFATLALIFEVIFKKICF